MNKPYKISVSDIDMAHIRMGFEILFGLVGDTIRIVDMEDHDLKGVTILGNSQELWDSLDDKPTFSDLENYLHNKYIECVVRGGI